MLADLTRASEAEVDRVVARYAALRAWLIRSAGAGDALLAHAVDAARRHLAAVDGTWPERNPLVRLLEAGTGPGAAALLEDLAEEARAAGHDHGARAFRQAAHRVRWTAARYPPPSAS